jgi:hypothetical protein
MWAGSISESWLIPCLKSTQIDFVASCPKAPFAPGLSLDLIWDRIRMNTADRVPPQQTFRSSLQISSSEKMLHAEMSRTALKRQSFIAQNGIRSRKNADFVYPLPPLILQLPIISVGHSRSVSPCVCHAGKRRFEGEWFHAEPRGNVRDVGQIWFRPTGLGHPRSILRLQRKCSKPKRAE